MRSDEINAGGWFTVALPLFARVGGPPLLFGVGTLGLVEAGGPCYRIGKEACPGAFGTFDKLANRVAEMAVPFGPAASVVRESAHLGRGAGGGEMGGRGVSRVGGRCGGVDKCCIVELLVAWLRKAPRF